MKKSVPDPPPENPTNETATEDPLRDRSALYRAIDFHLTGNNRRHPMNCASTTSAKT
ncbi:hypothetical protein JFT98_17900 [Erwinia sp. TH29]|uniref:hypothetical protein n=1 Tax=unclassified Erwinia TaxID=2622719 RepID=UPI001913BC49|nr:MULTISPECIES: hypothetical protein [unclassified Erwinia]MBK5303069.1 hypothetical protein [Bacillus sp. TH86]MBK5322838.1 hypothetical protein [Bacillus sp. TH59]MBK5337788.1 hypothetical protein [Bacillus sp. TH57]MBK5317335.1 hypothetical protein [Erwinia sp. TH79]MBK5422195.1 hypothetical protein [Erwinia sp. TH29]